MRWWYISFADEKEFLGGLFIQAYDMDDALQRADRRGLNPGGEAEGYGLRPETPCGMYANRLLTRDELVALDEAMEMIYGANKN